MSDRRDHVLPFGIIIGFIIGLTLDIYEINVFGEVGLGIVFGPMIGIVVATIYSSISEKNKQ